MHCFPTDNPYSCDRDTNGSYWSYQQHHQQQWNQWNQNEYSHSDNLGFKSCWMQQQQQQPMQQRQMMQTNNPSCMGFNPQYNQMHHQQHQQQQPQQQQQQIQSQHLLQQTGYRNNVVATVTVQSQSLSRTPSRCDSVRSETCESHCSSSLSGGSSGGIEDVTSQQYGMYQNFTSVQQQQQYPQAHLQQHQEHLQQQQQQQQQQCFWPSSHYDVQQEQQSQQMDYFRQQQLQQQQQQQYYRQQQVIQQQQQQQQQQTNCYWPRDASPVIQQQRQFICHNPTPDPIAIQTPACSSSPISADTTTISSSTSSPTTHFPTSDESVECAPLPPAAADENIESSAEISAAPAVTTDATPTTTIPPTATPTTTTTVASISVPAGWVRDISGGSVIYIRLDQTRSNPPNFLNRNLLVALAIHPLMSLLFLYSKCVANRHSKPSISNISKQTRQQSIAVDLHKPPGISEKVFIFGRPGQLQTGDASLWFDRSIDLDSSIGFFEARPAFSCSFLCVQ